MNIYEKTKVAIIIADLEKEYFDIQKAIGINSDEIKLFKEFEPGQRVLYEALVKKDRELTCQYNELEKELVYWREYYDTLCQS